MMKKPFYVEALVAVLVAGAASGFSGSSGGAQQAAAADADHDGGRTAANAQAQAQMQGGGLPPYDDSLDRKTTFQRGVTIGITGAVGAMALEKVGGIARGWASVGKVKHIPIYGKAITSLPKVGTKIPIAGPFLAKVPLIGKAAGAVTIPTTLGQTPFLGKAVSSIPIVGNTIAGPPNPIIVGAVAIDTYWLPKIAPCGYTESAFFTQTDFNSEPTLRHYVNYLAPLPYTHPPIYAPSTLNTGRTPNTGEASGGTAGGAVVSIPE